MKAPAPGLSFFHWKNQRSTVRASPHDLEAAKRREGRLFIKQHPALNPSSFLHHPITSLSWPPRMMPASNGKDVNNERCITGS